MDDLTKNIVAVVGAGPAGLFAAKELASQGVQVALFNRDIKPGGLAEYGIYPDKVKMKVGLRNQFRQVLSMPNVAYFGNVTIGRKGDLSLDHLKSLGFQAILVAAGAQGTKWLGLPGESLHGVYHAKDLVYHYNKLPPFSQQVFKIGKRVAIIGAGNVMMDIARYLISDRKVEVVTAIARRGPAEIKFDRKELETVAANLDLQAYDQEVERVAPIMRALGQDPESAKEFVHTAAAKSIWIQSNTRFKIYFLGSPTQILDDGQGHVSGIEVEDNTLAMVDGEIKARSLGSRTILDVDTVIFAIGDRVDNDLGLPVHNYQFDKNPEPQFPIDGESFELFDKETRQPLTGYFVAGWSRKASTGLVGYARKDGSHAARAVLQFLQPLPPAGPQVLLQLREIISRLPHPVVTARELAILEEAEQARAASLGLEDFKFASNREMLEVMSLANPVL